MKTIEVVQRLETVMMASGSHNNKKYLGMSQIHRTETELLDELLLGSKKLESKQLLIHSVSSKFEGLMLQSLEKAGVVIPKSNRTLVAAFDDRFRGQTNADFIDGTLCEIKSTIEDKIFQIGRDKHIVNAHYVQAQMYMYHGGYDRTMIVYVARDTGSVVVRSVRYDPKTATTYNEKAKRILNSLDTYK